jgi:hypothetical protein
MYKAETLKCALDELALIPHLESTQSKLEAFELTRKLLIEAYGTKPKSFHIRLSLVMLHKPLPLGLYLIDLADFVATHIERQLSKSL